MDLLPTSSYAIIQPDRQAKLNFVPTASTPTDQSSRFASALAHEVRNPLTNINLAVEMLNSAIKDEDLKMYVDIIMRSSIRIDKLINDLLRYQETGQAQPEKYSLHQLLDEILAMTADRIALKRIRVVKDYAALDCKIWIDKEKIRIAFINIIINAIDAMPSQMGELTLVTRSTDSKHVIEILDNGTGISKEDLRNIFKPYFTNKPGGMGLGLSTTLAILRSNRVEVDVRSEEGKGTRFILLVPKDI